jgi:hypothetical protein
MKVLISFLLFSSILSAQNHLTPREVYDFSIGDTLEYYIAVGTEFTMYQNRGTTRYAIEDKIYSTDSSEICYTVSSKSYNRVFNSSTGMYDTIRWTGSDMWCYSNLDSNLKYLPDYNYASFYDSIEIATMAANCPINGNLEYKDTVLLDNSFNTLTALHYSQILETCNNLELLEQFKIGFGKISSEFSYETSTYVSYQDTILTYIVKNGISYGVKDPVLRNESIYMEQFSILENPTSSLLILNGYVGLIEILDLRGNKVVEINYIKNGNDISFLENGFYFVRPKGSFNSIKFLKI